MNTIGILGLPIHFYMMAQLNVSLPATFQPVSGLRTHYAKHNINIRVLSLLILSWTSYMGFHIILLLQASQIWNINTLCEFFGDINFQDFIMMVQLAKSCISLSFPYILHWIRQTQFNFWIISDGCKLYLHLNTSDNAGPGEMVIWERNWNPSTSSFTLCLPLFLPWLTEQNEEINTFWLQPSYFKFRSWGIQGVRVLFGNHSVSIYMIHNDEWQWTSSWKLQLTLV